MARFTTEVFTEAPPALTESPMKLGGLLGVCHLQQEVFGEAQSLVVAYLWASRPQYQGMGGALPVGVADW